MIDCEYYSLNEASDILSIKKNMLVHFGATGKIPIYMLAAGIPIEIVQIEEGGREVFIDRRACDLSALKIDRYCLAGYERDPFNTKTEGGWLPPHEEKRFWAYFLEKSHGPGYFRLRKNLHDMKLVLMKEDLELLQAEERARNPQEPQNGLENTFERTLGTKERRTLLTIVAALCKKAKIDPKQRGAAQIIMALTEELGAKVSDDTIKGYLDQIPDALDSRMK